MSVMSKSVKNVARATSIVAAICVLALGNGAQAAPISSSIDLRPNADGTINAFLDSQGATLNTLGGTTTSNGAGGNTTISTASASWVSAGQGAVSLSNNWITVGQGNVNFTATTGQFNYRFIADASGTFQTNWTQTLTGTGLNALQFFTIHLENISMGGTQLQQLVGLGSGSQGFSLLAGTEYIFSIREQSNIGGSLSAGNRTHNLTLDWTAPINGAVVVAVSEPLPFAVLGLGLVCLGLVRRRKLI